MPKKNTSISASTRSSTPENNWSFSDAAALFSITLFPSFSTREDCRRIDAKIIELEESHRRTEESHRRSEESHRRSEESHRKAEETYLKTQEIIEERRQLLEDRRDTLFDVFGS